RTPTTSSPGCCTRRATRDSTRSRSGAACAPNGRAGAGTVTATAPIPVPVPVPVPVSVPVMATVTVTAGGAVAGAPRRGNREGVVGRLRKAVAFWAREAMDPVTTRLARAVRLARVVPVGLRLPRPPSPPGPKVPQPPGARVSESGKPRRAEGAVLGCRVPAARPPAGRVPTAVGRARGFPVSGSRRRPRISVVVRGVPPARAVRPTAVRVRRGPAPVGRPRAARAVPQPVPAEGAHRPAGRGATPKVWKGRTEEWGTRAHRCRGA